MLDASFFPPAHYFFGSYWIADDGGGGDDTVVKTTTTAGGPWDNVWHQSLQPVLLWYIPALLACYAACVVVLQHTTDWKGLKLQKLAGQLSMYPAFLVLIYTSHVTVLDPLFWSTTTTTDDDAEHHHRRMTHSSWHCDVFANLYIATNIVQAVGQLQTEKPPLLYQLMAHHILSVACYTAGFYFDRFRWWTAFAGCCEVTNLFLVPVFAAKEYFANTWRKQYWFLWNSRLLWMTFVTHRLLLFPAWLGLWIYDRWQYAKYATTTTTTTTAANDNDDTIIVIHWMEGIVYPVTILGLLILSCIWFAQIDRGLKKQVTVYLDATAAAAKKVQ